MAESERRVAVGVIRDPAASEPGTALALATVKALSAGEEVEVLVATGAGECAGIADEDYEDAGAEIVWTEEAWEAQILVCVNPPSAEFLRHYLGRGAEKAVVFHLPTTGANEADAALAELGAAGYGLGADASPREWQGLIDRLVEGKLNGR